MREQAAGIINHWDFDSIIMGSSMIENTSAKEASSELGGTFVNISLSGSDFFERKIVLDYALRKKEIKKIIFSIDNVGLIIPRKGTPLFDLSKWNYLYDENPFNDFDAYMNDKYLKCIFSFTKKRRCMGEKVDFDRPNAWHNVEIHSAKFGGLDNWFKFKDDAQVKWAFSSILNSLQQLKAGKAILDPYLNENILIAQNHLDDILIKLVSKNPNTQFIFILPPYSRIKYAIDAQYDKATFERYKASIKYLVSKSEIYKNMKIYGWGNEPFVDNIANYKDLNHFEYKINSWMLSAIKDQKGLLTVNNIDHYLQVFTEKSLNYDLLILGNKIEKYLHPIPVK